MKQHPIKILSLMTKNFWLLLIPLLRGLLSLGGNLYEWFSGAWLDLLVLLVIIGAAWLRWFCTRYSLSSRAISVSTGVLARRQFILPFRAICAASAEKKFFYRPFGAVKVLLDTNAGALRGADLSLTLRQKDYCLLFHYLNRHPKRAVSYHPGKLRLVFFSLLFSSTLSGALLLATLVVQSGKLLGRSLQDEILVTVTDLSQRLALGIPPLAIVFSLLLLTGWLFSFLGNLFRHLRFSVRRSGKFIGIRSGMFTLRRHFVNADKINYCDLRQNLLMKLFSVMSVHVNCTGYGKSKNEIPVFVPVTTKISVYSSLMLLLPAFKSEKITVRPLKRSWFRFMWFPVIGLSLLPIAALILHYFLPLLDSFTFFGAIMAGIPLFWLLIVKFIALFTTGVTMGDTHVFLQYCKGFSFHTLIIPREKIAKIIQSQSIFQRYCHCGDLSIFTNNEFTKLHKIYSLPLGKLGGDALFIENRKN